MSDTSKNSELFPYKDFSDIKIKNNEPMASSYFNSHLIRLWSNICALNNTNTLQKATDKQWGIVKFASIDDIINDDGNKNTVVSNKVLNDTIAFLKKQNSHLYMMDNVLNFSKNYHFRKGEFVVGLNESKAVKITNNPELVAFSNISFVPVGFDDIPFFTAKSTQSADTLEQSDISTGMLNFSKTDKPDGYEEFHVYYHKSGYVICKNGSYNNSQNQIRVVWTLFERKT